MRMVPLVGFLEVHLFPRDGGARGALPHHVPWLRRWLGRRGLHWPAGAAEVWSLGNDEVMTGFSTRVLYNYIYIYI